MLVRRHTWQNELREQWVTSKIRGDRPAEDLECLVLKSIWDIIGNETPTGSLDPDCAVGSGNYILRLM